MIVIDISRIDLENAVHYSLLNNHSKNTDHLKKAIVYVLYRDRKGKVLFDDVVVKELVGKNDICEGDRDTFFENVEWLEPDSTGDDNA